MDMEKTIIRVVVMCFMVAVLVCSNDMSHIPKDSLIVNSTAIFAARKLNGEFIQALDPAFGKVVKPDSEYLYDVMFEANFNEDSKIIRRTCNAVVERIVVSYDHWKSSSCRTTQTFDGN